MTGLIELLETIEDGYGERVNKKKKKTHRSVNNSRKKMKRNSVRVVLLGLYEPYL